METWAGPHQLIVVVPPGGRHFHQPYCPRAGLMDGVQYMPLTRALRRRLPRCQLCWPLHRVGEGQRTRHQGERTTAAGVPLLVQGETRSVRLTVSLPRLPPPRVRLYALSPMVYAAEWQALSAFLLAAILQSDRAGQIAVPRSGLRIEGLERISWPELLHAARRLLPRDSMADEGRMLAATGAWLAPWRVLPSMNRGPLLHSPPAGSTIRLPIGA